MDRVCHGMELPYVFGNCPPPGHFSSGEVDLSNDFMHFWSSFGEKGVPGNAQDGSKSDWTMYGSSENTAVLQVHAVEMEPGYSVPKCDFWDSLGWYWIPQS